MSLPPFLFASCVQPGYLPLVFPDPFLLACLAPVSYTHSSSFPIGSNLLSTCLPVVSNYFTVHLSSRYGFVFRLPPNMSQLFPFVSSTCLLFVWHCFLPAYLPPCLLPIVCHFFWVLYLPPNCLQFQFCLRIMLPLAPRVSSLLSCCLSPIWYPACVRVGTHDISGLYVHTAQGHWSAYIFWRGLVMNLSTDAKAHARTHKHTYTGGQMQDE